MARQVQRGHGTTPPGNPLARAYFRAIEWTAAADVDSEAGRLAAVSGDTLAPEDAAAAIAAFVGVLVEAGVVPEAPRALLAGRPEDARPCARIQTQLQLAHDRDAAASSMRSQELAYLANALAAGCSIQGRPLSLQEASDAVAAVCNLGLENWPLHWLPAEARRGSSVPDAGTALPDDFLVGHDLVSVFQVGWTVLYDDVCMYVAKELIRVLAELRCDDSEIRAGLKALRTKMTKAWRAGEPWRAGDALDAIVVLDMPAWATLLALIDECPVIHAGLGASVGTRTRAVSATAFTFISENSQIAAVREFMRSLPEILRR
jgi:hypothetical protein